MDAADAGDDRLQLAALLRFLHKRLQVGVAQVRRRVGGGGGGGARYAPMPLERSGEAQPCDRLVS